MRIQLLVLLFALAATPIYGGGNPHVYHPWRGVASWSDLPNQLGTATDAGAAFRSGTLP